MSKMKGNTKVEFVLLLVFLLVASLGSWAVKEYKCANYEEMTMLQTKYKLFDGCYVKTDNGWLLREQIRDLPIKGE